MKTRHTSYSSFHLSIPEDQKDLINCNDAWPEGVLVKPFTGKLLKNYILESYDSLDPDGKSSSKKIGSVSTTGNGITKSSDDKPKATASKQSSTGSGILPQPVNTKPDFGRQEAEETEEEEEAKEAEESKAEEEEEEAEEAKEEEGEKEAAEEAGEEEAEEEEEAKKDEAKTEEEEEEEEEAADDEESEEAEVKEEGECDKEEEFEAEEEEREKVAAGEAAE
ncbi:hypothetical protein M8J75_007001 [Diaphorina citri]|nr:hypothetical protein M8J75_007001 [Diaphorina citri]